MSSHAEAAMTSIRLVSPKRTEVAKITRATLHRKKQVMSKKSPPATDLMIHGKGSQTLISEKLESPTALEQDNNDDPQESTTDDAYEDDIEQIHLSPIHLLNQAIDSRDLSYYYQALNVDADRAALEKRAQQLQHRLEIELKIRSRKLTSKYYGWTEVPWSAPLSSQVSMNLDDLWRNLRNTTAHEYLLEDPSVSSTFFDSMRQLMVGQDFENMYDQWGPAFGNQMEQYLGDYPEVWKPRKPLYVTGPRKTKKKILPKRDENKPSIAKQRFEEDIARREAELRIEMSKTFKANPVPISSLVPKYKAIMSTKGNKSAEMRQKASEEKRAKLLSNLSTTVQETLLDIKQEESKKRAVTITSPTILDAGNEGRRRRQKLIENESKAGLTTEHTFTPRISKVLPDYEKLQKKFQEQLDSKKSQRPPTVPLPFKNVEKHQAQGVQHQATVTKKIAQERKKQEGEQVKPVPYYKSVIPPTMMTNELGAQETRAWKLTLEHKKIQKEVQLEAQKKEEELLKEKKEKIKTLAAKLRAKLHLQDTQTNERHKDSLKRLKSAQKQREKDHQKELQDMNERINQRLSLFEQAQISSAKAKAKAEFQAVLKMAGLAVVDF